MGGGWGEKMVWAFNLGSTGSGRWMGGAIQCSCGLCFAACVSICISDILFGGGHDITLCSSPFDI